MSIILFLISVSIEIEFSTETEQDQSWSADAIVARAKSISKLKDTIHTKAKKNIDHAQEIDKKYYDLKHADNRVS